MTVVATLKDGRVIAKATITSAVDRVDAGKLYITATLTDLKTVEDVLQYNLNVVPNTTFAAEKATISGNVVGVTVNVGAGTTVEGTSEIIAIGF